MLTSRLLSCLALLSLLPCAQAAKIELVAGGGSQKAPCAATDLQLKEPFGVEFTPKGEMVIVEMAMGQRVFRIQGGKFAHLIAGTGMKGNGGDGGDPKEAQFAGIHNLAIAPDGSIYVADSFNQRIRKISADLTRIDAYAGSGAKGFGGDGGPALQAAIGTPMSVALDPKNEYLLTADLPNRRIRRVNLKTGVIETVAGNGKRGVPVDGQPAIEQPLQDPRAVVADQMGGLYILEREGHSLRYVDAAGKIKTVVGTGQRGLSGDGGPALQATMNGPKHLCMDRDGSVIIADAENHVIRRFDPKTGLITRVAGTGRKGNAGLGGDPLQCDLARPHGVTIGPDGLLYITDSYNDRILRIAP